MPRIAITEEDLDEAGATPAVYAPVGGREHPEVYGRVEKPRAERRSRPVPTWLKIAGVAALIIVVGVGAFFLGKGSRVSESELQSQLTQQRNALVSERRSAVSEASAEARASARRRYTEQLRSATQAAREQGRRVGRREGYADGLQAGRSETTTIDCSTSTLLC